MTKPYVSSGYRLFKEHAVLQLAPEQLLKLGQYHQERRELSLAEETYRQVLTACPNHVPDLRLLGYLLGQTGHKEAGVEFIRRAIALDPQDPRMYTDLGVWLADLQRFDEAIAAHRMVIRLVPASAIAHYNLAAALDANGELDQALDALRKALRLSHGKPSIHSGLIFWLQFHPVHGAKLLREELAAWSRTHADPLKAFIRPHTNERSPDRPLRIGYVCADFRDHCLGRYLLPLFEQHDPRQFQVYCFSDVTTPDAMTEKFRGLAQGFQTIAGRSDQEAAELIRATAIDILVDTTLHMVFNRLLVFARKPAPVQATFAAYPGSTGLDTIDYRLTDPYLDPPGQDDSIYCETSVRALDSFWCYDPHSEVLPVNDLPALSTGHVTFGCLNAFRKVNTPLLQLWAEVLHAVPASRLLMLAPLGSRQRVVEFMATQGLAANRFAFSNYLARREYLALYHDIDIGLDTHPYNGHTTSLESFFMGVPVITRVGDRVVGRAGFSQLMNLGLPELVAHSEAQFVQIAATLAADLPRLAALRHDLRPRMQASPLMDAGRFARNIEAAYRQMWRTWCAGAAQA